VGDRDKLLEVIGSMYDSILEDSKWLDALQQVAVFTGGIGAFHIVANPLTAAIVHSESVGVDPEVNKRYLQYYAAKDVRIPPALSLSVGHVVTEEVLLAARDLQRSEIYAELLLPFDIPHIMAAWLRKRATAFEVVVMEGSRRRGPFSAQAQSRFSTVVPHLIRAVKLREMLYSVRQQNRAYRAALESLAFGVIMLDERGHVIEATSAAEQVLRAADGLLSRQRRLHAVFSDDDRRLQRLVHEAVTGRAAGGSLTLRRSNERGSLAITTIPLGLREHLAFPQLSALLIVVDPEQTPQPIGTVLEHMFELTKAEAALVATLFDGVTLREAAASLDRSVNTCKTQLKAIYRKTGCRNHAELAKKVLMTALFSHR
jgi:DNA-binding CsgD family transcriptional regulator/PAS domain-containing protein